MFFGHSIDAVLRSALRAWNRHRRQLSCTFERLYVFQVVLLVSAEYTVVLPVFSRLVVVDLSGSSGVSLGLVLADLELAPAVLIFDF